MNAYRWILILGLVVGSAAHAEEPWPRYRGANGTGVADASCDPPLEWSAEKNLKWKVVLPGAGSSSPVVWGDRVFVTTFEAKEDGSIERQVVAVDRDSGEILWGHKVAPGAVEDPNDGFIQEHGFASGTPVTDGERVYAFFGKAGVVALSREGKLLWEAQTGLEWSSKRWGSASSPILFEDLLIVQAGDEARSVFAFDKLTGESRWVAGPYDALEQTYSTPVIHVVSEDRTDLIVGAVGELWGLNPENGKLRWFAEMGLRGNIAASPTVTSDGVILQSGGFPRTLGTGIRGGGAGEVTATNVLWENNDANSYINTPVEHEGLVYWTTDSGIAKCADPTTGELKYEARLPDLGGAGGRGKPIYTAPVIVGEHVLVTTRTSGTYVIRATPEKLDVVQINRIEGDETRFQGTPAVVGDEIFLRSESALYCIAHE